MTVQRKSRRKWQTLIQKERSNSLPANTYACMHIHDRDRERERDRDRDRQTDRRKKRCFNEIRTCCEIPYDHSVWPASKDEG